jgi:hypothetical protein
VNTQYLTYQISLHQSPVYNKLPQQLGGLKQQTFITLQFL